VVDRRSGHAAALEAISAVARRAAPSHVRRVVDAARPALARAILLARATLAPRFAPAAA
jgi:hypothetical protein